MEPKELENFFIFLFWDFSQIGSKLLQNYENNEVKTTIYEISF